MVLAQTLGLGALLIVVLLVAVVIVRRAVLVRAGSFDVSWRVDPGADDRGWILGQARFRDGRLALYRSFSAWPRASLTLDRAALALDAVRPPVGAEPDLLPRGVAIVTGRCTDTRIELALAEDALTALRSWVESRPPGSRLPDRGQPGDDDRARQADL